MKQDTCIIYYHGNAWDGVPARQRYLMQAMAAHVPVIYLDTTEKKKWSVHNDQVAENITVVRGLIPLVTRFKRRGWNTLMHASFRWHLRWVREKYERIILWNADNWLRPQRFISHDFLIFDCIDPSFDEDPTILAHYHQREQEMLRAADLVIASADALVDECHKSHRDVILINNACEPAEYDAALLAQAAKPNWWPAATQRVVAYLGTLDYRVDFSMLAAAAANNPDLTFIYAGAVPPELNDRVAALQKIPNVLCPGLISVDAGRYLLSRCSVGLIPFRANAMNDAINPVKMYAYALLGKPVVGTNIRELRDRPDIVHTADTAEAFSAAVRRAIYQSEDAAHRRHLQQFAAENTWTHRAQLAWDEIQNRLESAAQPPLTVGGPA